MTAAIHPIFASILAQAAELPAQVRRAEYASRLIRMDWEFEHAPAEQWRSGRAELRALEQLRDELDPLHSIWNRHAKGKYLTHGCVRSFKDFTGPVPVVIEWAMVGGTPRITAVVVNIAGKGPCSIGGELSPQAMARYETKLQALLASAAPDQLSEVA